LTLAAPPLKKRRVVEAVRPGGSASTAGASLAAMPIMGDVDDHFVLDGGGPCRAVPSRPTSFGGFGGVPAGGGGAGGVLVRPVARRATTTTNTARTGPTGPTGPPGPPPRGLLLLDWSAASAAAATGGDGKDDEPVIG
jgi:hypothetical protein